MKQERNVEVVKADRIASCRKREVKIQNKMPGKGGYSGLSELRSR